MDNMLASIKAALDALAEAWGVDDCRFVFELTRANPWKLGAILIEVA